MDFYHYLIVSNYFIADHVCYIYFLKPATVAVIFK